MNRNDNTLLIHEAPRRTRREAGATQRADVPLESHTELPATDERCSAIDTIVGQDEGRLAPLVPIRHGRMAANAFTFYRGAAAVMASDLSLVPSTDIRLQLCGDAHLSNYGAFLGPDRRLVFDLNDFDETLPGPFEWDVKRLAASVTIACRHNGFDEADGARATRAAVRGYRKQMADAEQRGPLELQYHRLEVDQLINQLGDRRSRKVASGNSARAVKKNSLKAMAKLTHIVDGRRQIVDDPPLVRRLEDAFLPDQLVELDAFFRRYVDTLPTHRRHVLRHYAVVDVAHKIVGVGSVGTRCLIILLESGDGEPLFLQFKEARASVLEPFCGASEYEFAGERVVEGQRMMQTMGDIFLGWSHFDGDIVRGSNQYYFRQLWDGKGSVDTSSATPDLMKAYARMCGEALALAHARCGDASVICGYLGDDSTFDEALTEFARRYADVNEADFTTHASAIADGTIEARFDL